MTLHKQPLWSRSVASALAMSMAVTAARRGDTGAAGGHGSKAQEGAAHESAAHESAAHASDDDAAALTEARECRDKGDLRTAVMHLKLIVSRNVAHSEALLMLGELYTDLNDLPSAIGAYRAARAAGPQDGTSSVLLATVLLMHGEFAQVLGDTDQASSGSHRASLLGLRAQALLATGNHGEAARLLDDALQLNAECPEALLGKARMAASRQRFLAADDFVRRALASNPGDVQALRFHADLLYADGNHDGALAAHMTVLERHPFNVQTLLDITDLRTQTGRFPAAQLSVDCARKIGGSSAQVLYMQALLRYRQQGLSEAGELAERILRAAPEFSPALLLAAAAKLSRKEYHAAERYLQQFLHIHPSHLFAIKLTATLQVDAGHPQAALALLAPLLDEAAADRELLAIAAAANVHTGDFSTAAHLFGTAGGMHPAAPRLHAALVLSRLGSHDHCRQICVLERAIGTPGDPAGTAVLAIMTAMHNGEQDRAAAALNALMPAVDNPLVQDLAGDVALGRDDTRQARNHFTRALSLDPAYLPALRKLQQLDAAERKPAETTRNRYLVALAAAPANGALMEALSTLALSHHHATEAVSWMEQAAAAQPASLPVALRLCGLYLDLGQHARAVSAASQLAAAHPACPEVLCLLGRASLLAGDHRRAADAFNRAASFDPDSGTPHFLLATLFLAQNQDAAALAALRKALLIDPALFDARKALVDLFIRHHRFTEALCAAVAAQQPGPSAAAACQLEGKVHAAQGRHALASQAYERAFSIAPDSDLLIALHASMVREGRTAQARERLLRWLERHPVDVAARLHYATSLLAEHDPAGAAIQLEIVLTAAPDNLEALNDLAWICQQLGDSKALGLAQRALALAPDSPAILDTLAWIHLEQGELSRALPLLQKASGLAPHAGEIHFHLGSVLSRLGDHAGARRALDKAMACSAPFAQRADARNLLASLSNAAVASVAAAPQVQ